MLGFPGFENLVKSLEFIRLLFLENRDRSRDLCHSSHKLCQGGVEGDKVRFLSIFFRFIEYHNQIKT